MFFFFDYFLSILPGLTITISFLRFCVCFAVSAALISHHRVVFRLGVCACSSAVIFPHAFLGQLIFSSLCLTPCAILLHPLCSTRSRVTRATLYGAPWDVSVISRSLISESSSWQRTKLREAQAQGRRQLMRPHTPTVSAARPLPPLAHRSDRQQWGGRSRTPLAGCCKEMFLITEG